MDFTKEIVKFVSEKVGGVVIISDSSDEILYADGYFAKKFDAASEFGRKLDPITDKVFALSLLIPLAVSNPLTRNRIIV